MRFRQLGQVAYKWLPTYDPVQKPLVVVRLVIAERQISRWNVEHEIAVGVHDAAHESVRCSRLSVISDIEINGGAIRIVVLTRTSAFHFVKSGRRRIGWKAVAGARGKRKILQMELMRIAAVVFPVDFKIVRTRRWRSFSSTVEFETMCHAV